MKPVHVSEDDIFFVHDDDAVVMTCGKRLVKARLLIGYVLAEYVDGDDADPTRTDCVDKYIMNALAKHHAYTVKANRELCPPRPSQQHQDCDNETCRGLPFPLCTSVSWGLNFWESDPAYSQETTYRLVEASCSR